MVKGAAGREFESGRKIAQKNIKLEKKAKGSGKKPARYSAEDGALRYKGRLVEPKGGWVLDGSKYKNRDKFFKAGNVAAERLFAKGYDWDRVTQELAHLNDSFWEADKKRKEIAAAEKRDSRNQFKKANSLFDNDSIWGKPAKFKDYQEVKDWNKSAVGKSVNKGAKKLGHGLADIIHNIERGLYAENSSLIRNAEDKEKRAGEYEALSNPEKMAHDLFGYKVEGNKREYKKGASLKKKPVGYEVIDKFAPNLPTGTKIGLGLTSDIVIDPFTYAGVGVLRIPSKAIGSIKAAKASSKLALSDVKMSSEVLKDYSLRPKHFRDHPEVRAAFSKYGISQNKRLDASDWEKVLGENAGKDFATHAERKAAIKQTRDLYKSVREVLGKHAGRGAANEQRVGLDLALAKSLQKQIDLKISQHAAGIGDDVLKEQYGQLPKYMRQRAAVEHLLKTTDPALEGRRQAAERYMKTVQKFRGKEFRFSTKINGKDVMLPLGNKGVEQFYHDMRNVVTPEYIERAQKIGRLLKGEAEPLHPSVQKFLDAGLKADKESPVGIAARAFQNAAKAFPHLADRIVSFRYSDDTENAIMSAARHPSGGYDVKVNQDGIFAEFERYKSLTPKQIYARVRAKDPFAMYYKHSKNFQEFANAVMIHEFGHIAHYAIQDSKMAKKLPWGLDTHMSSLPGVSWYGKSGGDFHDQTKGAYERFAEWFLTRHFSGENLPRHEIDDYLEHVLRGDDKVVDLKIRQALHDAKNTKLPFGSQELRQYLRENNVKGFNSLEDPESFIKGGIDLKDLSPSYLAFYDKLRDSIGPYGISGYGLTEARLDREAAVHGYEFLNAEVMQGLMTEARTGFIAEANIIKKKLANPNLTPVQRTALMKEYRSLEKEYKITASELKAMKDKANIATEEVRKQVNAQRIIDSMGLESDSRRIGLSLRVMGHDVLKITDPLRLAERASSMPIIKQGVEGWRKRFENFEKYANRHSNPLLEIIRNVSLGGTARVFQIYAKQYHKMWDGISVEARKAQLDSLVSKLEAGVKSKKLTGRDKEIHDLFASLVKIFNGETKIGNSTLTRADILRYLPETFTFAKGNTEIKSVKDLLEALGSGVGTKLKDVGKQTEDLEKAIVLQRGGHLTRKIEGYKRQYHIASTIKDKKAMSKMTTKINYWEHLQEVIKEGRQKEVLKGYKKQTKRLNKAKENEVWKDPLQAVWAARIAAEQAAGWKNLIESIGTQFGILHEGKNVNGSIRFDADIEDLIKQHGWKTNSRVEGYVFDPQTAKQVDKLLELFDVNNIGKTREFFDKATRAWKVSATLYNPGYYTRNIVGEITAGWFGGVTQAEYYARSGRILNDTRKNAELDELLRSHTPFGELLSRGRADESRVVGTTRGGEKITHNAIVTMYHENNLITNFVNTEFHEVGSNIGGVSKLGKYPKKYIHEPLRALGEVGENFPRMAHFLHALEHAPKHLNLREAGQWAASEVRKYHFDYSDVTPFEKAVMMRLIPFYKWTRKAMPMVAETLLTKPGKLTAYPKGMTAFAYSQNENYNNDGFIPAYDENVPPFIQAMIAYPVGTDAEGNATFLNINTPGFEGLKAMFNPAGAAQLMLNPFIKTPIEQLYGEKLNEQFDKDGMDKRQRLSEVLSQVPATKEIDDTIRRRKWKPTNYDPEWSEPGAPIDEAGLSYLTGATALEVKKPFQFKQPNYWDKTFWGKYRNMGRQMGEAKDAGKKLPDEFYREFNLMRRDNPEKFQQFKGLSKAIDDKGNLDFNAFQYYNKWTSPFAKYIVKTKNGKFVVDWPKVNYDRAHGLLEQATPEDLALDEKLRLKRIAKRRKG